MKKYRILVFMITFLCLAYANLYADEIILGSQYGEIPVYLDPDTVIESYKDYADESAEDACESTATRISDYLVSKIEDVEDGAAIPTLVSAHYICE